ncbi:MAG: stalk domain-containing protein [Defluviitaleaceae bacterium]|nr:stalk domain-containing protein [Defluviitaleaceae bacterium]
MNKQTAKGFILGVLTIALLLPTIGVLASATTRSIDVTFRNIRIFMDGNEVIPRDGAGNRVEPFVFEGTTYLPVRAVGEAFGRDVNWDATNAIVHLNTPSGIVIPPPPPQQPIPTPPPVVQQSRLLVDVFPEPTSHLGLRNPQQHQGENYTINNRHFPNSLRGVGSRNDFNLTYTLNGQYTLLTGYAGFTATGIAASFDTMGSLKFFGDGVLLTEISLERNVDAVPFSVNLTGVQSLFIEADSDRGAAYVIIGTPRIQ